LKTTYVDLWSPSDGLSQRANESSAKTQRGTTCQRATSKSLMIPYRLASPETLCRFSVLRLRRLSRLPRHMLRTFKPKSKPSQAARASQRGGCCRADSVSELSLNAKDCPSAFQSYLPERYPERPRARQQRMP